MPAARFLAPLADREATLRAERRLFDAGMSESALMELAAERCFHQIARFVSLPENARNGGKLEGSACNSAPTVVDTGRTDITILPRMNGASPGGAR